MAQAPEKDPIRELVRTHERIRARAAGTDACPDASVLAAYFERTLTAAEVTRWEGHFAGCVRCREQLAALARVDAGDSSKSGAITTAPWWRTHRWFPAAAMAAAAVIAVAVIVRERSSRKAPEPEMVALSGSAAVSSAPQAAPVAADKTAAPADALRRDDRQREKRGERKSDITGELTTNSPQAAISSYGKKELFKRSAPASGELMRQASKAPAQEASHESTSLKLAKRALQPAAPVPEGAARFESLASRGATAGAIGGATNQTSGAPAAQNQAAAGLPGAPAIMVVPPDHTVGWMIGANGAISRYAEGGTWSPQESNVTSDLIAGAAVSRSVCWVVGRSGTILRTLDGVHWDKIAAPTGADIVGVTSDSSSNATVTTGDHKTYTTSDGGATWHSR